MNTNHLSLRKLLSWIDDNLVLILAALLIIFIPLYPKIPLWSPIEQYIVRVRLEDLLILIALPLTCLQIWRGKARLPSKVMIGLFVAYAVVGALSLLWSMFVINIIPLELMHVGKSALHFFRYLEYFSVFFVAYAAIRNKSDLKVLLMILATSVLAIAIYGYLQKFFYWPVYSTMNREFSKGIRLILTEHARIQSTFAGHYDMAAYLVIVLPILMSLAFSTLKWAKKILLFLSFSAGLWLVVMSASRMPFAASLLGIALVILLHAVFQPTWTKKLVFLLSRSLIFGLFFMMLLYYFGQGMLDRLSTVVSNADNPISLTVEFDKLIDPLPIPNSQQLIAWLPKAPALPEAAEPAPDMEAALVAQIVSISDQPPVPVQPPTVAPAIPRDVYEVIPEPVTETVINEDGSTSMTVIHKTRVYSDCALKHELSLCIRLESLWPWAWQSFTSSPIFGTGYATLNKQFVEEFTVADSTDNNYLRILGETGLLGMLAFMSILGYLVWQSVKNLRSVSAHLIRPLLIGFLAATIGLLINAVYIDVFAASKVAYTYWLVAGMVLASINLSNQLPTSKLTLPLTQSDSPSSSGQSRKSTPSSSLSARKSRRAKKKSQKK